MNVIAPLRQLFSISRPSFISFSQPFRVIRGIRETKSWKYNTAQEKIKFKDIYLVSEFQIEKNND